MQMKKGQEAPIGAKAVRRGIDDLSGHRLGHKKPQ